MFKKLLMDEEIRSDLFRSQGKCTVKTFLYAIRKDESFKYMFFWRNLKFHRGGGVYLVCKFFRKQIYRTNGIEIPLTVKIGYGMQMIHPRNITINSQAVIGDNFTILKGATIGSQLRGKNEGAPTIGNNVYVGVNAVIVGKIKIGNNVLIAPNSYVNFDVPDNSVVLGNPGICHTSENATVGYIKNQYESKI